MSAAIADCFPQESVRRMSGVLMRRENMLNLESDGVRAGAGKRLVKIPRCFPEGNDAAQRQSCHDCWTRSGPGRPHLVRRCDCWIRFKSSAHQEMERAVFK